MLYKPRYPEHNLVELDRNDVEVEFLFMSIQVHCEVSRIVGNSLGGERFSVQGGERCWCKLFPGWDVVSLNEALRHEVRAGTAVD